MENTRQPEHEVHELILRRHSPRALAGEVITKEQLMQLFEAAKWAPSSYNDQPWRFLYATRDSPHWQTYLSCLVEFNQSWAKNGAVLVAVLSRKGFSSNDKPNRNHSFDAGAAWENLALQATAMGLVTHAMAGFDADNVRSSLKIPDIWEINCMVAIGAPGNTEDLPKEMQDKEVLSGRKPLAETVFEGTFPS